MTFLAGRCHLDSSVFEWTAEAEVVEVVEVTLGYTG